MHIVLVEPEIPPNTGNIARLCAITGCTLHLVEPLGFCIDDKHLKRAGLDYWQFLDVHVHKNIDEVLQQYADHVFYFSTTKAKKCYTEVSFDPDCVLVFGKETAGLPESLLHEHATTCIRVPMREETRSLNLSNSVAVVVYEALRQQGFPGMI